MNKEQMKATAKFATLIAHPKQIICIKIIIGIKMNALLTHIFFVEARYRNL